MTNNMTSTTKLAIIASLALGIILGIVAENARFNHMVEPQQQQTKQMSIERIKMILAALGLIALLAGGIWLDNAQHLFCWECLLH